MKKQVSPLVSILVILAVLAVVAAVLWVRSEAPVVNKLPRPMGMGSPSASPKKAAPAGGKASPTEHGRTAGQERKEER